MKKIKRENYNLITSPVSATISIADVVMVIVTLQLENRAKGSLPSKLRILEL